MRGVSPTPTLLEQCCILSGQGEDESRDVVGTERVSFQNSRTSRTDSGCPDRTLGRSVDQRVNKSVEVGRIRGTTRD